MIVLYKISVVFKKVSSPILLGGLLFLLACFLHANRAFAQQADKIPIKGTVKDSSGVALPGVFVASDNKTKFSTQTDLNGNFSIYADPGSIVKFSFIGFTTKQIVVDEGTKILNITLVETNLQIDQVVVTAFGRKERKEAVVGAVTTVRPQDLKIPASNLTTALAGQVAGIIGYQRSGQPGQDNAAFFIRGVTTFGYKQDPLILIDNVELTASDLARLQVDDIESFSILKDASATALYGARGANGVILVSTKEGVEGKAQISFRLENSFSQSAQTVETSDPITYMNLYNEATITRDPLKPLPFTQNKIINTIAAINGDPGSNPYVYPAVDWLDLLFKKRTSTQRANMSVRGGGGVARYYVAGSYNLDNGILNQDERNNNDNNIKFRNYQLRSNVNIDLTKTTELIVRLSGNFNEYNGPVAADGGFSTDLYKYAVHTSPVLFPAYYPADAANQNTQHILFGNVAGVGQNNILYNNPYAALLRGHKNSSESRMSAQLEANQDLKFITPGLKFRGVFSTNRYSYFDSQMAYSPFYYNIGAYDKGTDIYSLNWLNPQPTGNNVATEYLNYYPGEPSLSTFVYSQAALDYAKKLGDNHNISATLVGTAQQTIYSNAKDPKNGQRTLQYSLPYRNLGLAGRLTYSYKSKYFLESNFGYNGSERFSENNRFGFFPTIGAGWMVSQEKFFEPLTNVISKMKLRASYGLVGNDAIGSQRFFYVSDVNLSGGGNYAFFGTENGYQRNGVYINSYENRDVTWETSRQANAAIELSMFKGLDIVAELYHQYRYDILTLRSSIPTTGGFEAIDFNNSGKPDIRANNGIAISKGIDLSLDYRRKFGRDLFLSARSNFTLTSNKYKYIEEPQWNESYRFLSGQPINRSFGYIAERLFVDDKEAQNSPSQIFSTNGVQPKGGDIKYRDLNNDGKIDGADQTFLGYSQTPGFVYGFGFSGTYKSFDLSAFFQGQARVSFFIDPRRTSPFIPSPDQYIGGNTQLIKQFAESHWSESNQDLYALYPRLGTNSTDIENNLQNSTWWMRDGSFIRLKSVEVGYTLPKKFVQRIKVNNARIYLNGLNLATFSKFRMWDPELSGNAFNYPIQKVFNLGINVSL